MSRKLEASVTGSSKPKSRTYALIMGRPVDLPPVERCCENLILYQNRTIGEKHSKPEDIRKTLPMSSRDLQLQ